MFCVLDKFDLLKLNVCLDRTAKAGLSMGESYGGVSGYDKQLVITLHFFC